MCLNPETIKAEQDWAELMALFVETSNSAESIEFYYYLSPKDWE